MENNFFDKNLGSISDLEMFLALKEVNDKNKCICKEDSKQRALCPVYNKEEYDEMKIDILVEKRLEYLKSPENKEREFEKFKLFTEKLNPKDFIIE